MRISAVLQLIPLCTVILEHGVADPIAHTTPTVHIVFSSFIGVQSFTCGRVLVDPWDPTCRPGRSATSGLTRTIAPRLGAGTTVRPVQEFDVRGYCSCSFRRITSCNFRCCNTSGTATSVELYVPAGSPWFVVRGHTVRAFYSHPATAADRSWSRFRHGAWPVNRYSSWPCTIRITDRDRE